MKRAVSYIFLIGIFLYGCAVQQNYAPQVVGDNVVLQDEEEEYELIILDNGFYSWFVTNSRPVSFYSLSYYEVKNQRYVTAWNSLYHRYGGRGPFENQINYHFGTNYGLKLNYQLFWYLNTSNPSTETGIRFRVSFHNVDLHPMTWSLTYKRGEN